VLLSIEFYSPEFSEKLADSLAIYLAPCEALLKKVSTDEAKNVSVAPVAVRGYRGRSALIPAPHRGASPPASTARPMPWPLVTSLRSPRSPYRRRGDGAPGRAAMSGAGLG